MPPGVCVCGSTQPSRGTACSRQRGYVGAGEGEIPRRRLDLCLRGSNDSGSRRGQISRWNILRRYECRNAGGHLRERRRPLDRVEGV